MFEYPKTLVGTFANHPQWFKSICIFVPSHFLVSLTYIHILVTCLTSTYEHDAVFDCSLPSWHYINIDIV